MEIHFPLKLMVSTQTGAVPLRADLAQLPLPRGLNSTGPIIIYGPYLEALSDFLANESYQALKAALDAQPAGPIPIEAVREVEIISEKHGAIYNVARVRIHLQDDKCCSLALNAAVGTEQQGILEREFNLLQELYGRFGLPFLPRPFFKGDAVYCGEGGVRLPLKLFLAEWFEGYHEFHLSVASSKESSVIKVWDLIHGEFALSPEETRSLYRKAASILTAYLDEDSFREIYPWHHAAGDFIVKHGSDGLELRLITVRDYRSLVPPGSEPGEQWVAIVHFLFNLSLRMRLDRLDGVGELAWAGDDCVSSVLEGFFDAWAGKADKTSSLPSPADVHQLLCSFSIEEWLSLGELIMEDGLVEEDELNFIRPLFEAHTISFCEALRKISV